MRNLPLLSALAFLLILFGFLWAYGVIGTRLKEADSEILFPRDTKSAFNSDREDKSVVRILLLGTSITARGNWPDTLKRYLSTCSNSSIEVTRLASAGASSLWGLEALHAYLEDPRKQDPDIVIIEFSINDASLWHGMSISASRSNTHNLVAMVRRTKAIPFLATMNPSWGLNFLERPGHRRYRAAYGDIARETGSGFIDGAPDWLALSETERSLLVPDDLHPTSEAMDRFVVPKMVKALSPLVCS